MSKKLKSSLLLILPLFLTVSCNYQIEVHQKRNLTDATPTPTTTPSPTASPSPTATPSPTPTPTPVPTPTPYTQMFESAPFQQTSGTFSANCITIDPSDGSRYVANIFSSGTITLGSNTYDSNSTNGGIVLTKQSRAGTLLWSKFIDGDGSDVLLGGASSCLALADGKLFLAFLSQSSSLTVDSYSDSMIGFLDSYILGFNTNDGSLSYHRHFGTANHSSQIVSLTSLGNTIYWSGLLQDDSLPGPSADCSSGCTSYGAIDASTGTALWDRRWGGGASIAYGIAVGNNQDLYLVGLYQSTGVDIGDGNTFDSVGLASGYIEKVSAVDGSPVWVRKMTSSYITEAFSIQTNGNDQVYFTLLTQDSSLDFEGGGSHSVTSGGGLIASYDSDGNFQWVTDPPFSYLPTQIVYDSKYQRLFASDVSTDPNSMPFMRQLNPDDGTLLDSAEATSSDGGIAQAAGIALDPNNSSFVVIAILSGSVEINGITYTAPSGLFQTVFFEWK